MALLRNQTHFLSDLNGLRAEITALKRKHPLSSLETGISGKRPTRG